MNTVTYVLHSFFTICLGPVPNKKEDAARNLLTTKYLLPKEFQITSYQNQLFIIYNASLFYNLHIILIDKYKLTLQTLESQEIFPNLLISNLN